MLNFLIDNKIIITTAIVIYFAIDTKLFKFLINPVNWEYTFILVLMISIIYIYCISEGYVTVVFASDGTEESLKNMGDNVSKAVKEISKDSGKGSYESNSMLDIFDINIANDNPFIELLSCNLILSLVILYLLFAMALFFFSSKYLTENLNITWIEKITNKKIHDIIKRILIYLGKSNKWWMYSAWIMIVISIFMLIFINYFILTHLHLLPEYFKK